MKCLSGHFEEVNKRKKECLILRCFVPSPFVALLSQLYVQCRFFAFLKLFNCFFLIDDIGDPELLINYRL